MADIRYQGVGRLAAIIPLNDQARAFCNERWPYGAPNTCRNTEGGQLLGQADFADALVAFADAGLEVVSLDEWVASLRERAA